jgi:exosortase D (VPLPA-CTERM-specific)
MPWRASWLWVWLVAGTALLLTVFYGGLSVMVQGWSGREEYSHGFALPVVAAFLVWQKKNVLATLPPKGSWTGLLIVCAGVGLYLAGELSTLYVIVQYSFLIVLAGLVLTFLGLPAFRIIWAPLVVLAFMIPLPNFLYQGLSGQLQLISSQIGVSIIRLFNVSVFLEGNVIDLGSYKLQVVEACSGLRYLFPLMALAFIAAYFFNAPWWKRVIVFLSAIPITILMNSFRIGIIGVMVEHWGRSAAEGFLHQFEGWVIFMACTVVIAGEMWLLDRIGARRGFREVFVVEWPARTAPETSVLRRPTPKPFLGALSILAVTALASLALPARVESALQRKDLAQFPMTMDQWRGAPEKLDAIYLETLKLDDYLLANFSSKDRRPVNLYVAYYASQRKGESAHSPRSCIPGGGWEIEDLTQRSIRAASVANRTLQVNRVLIQRGDDKALVYYWFQQRGRIMTNEYFVKWYLFWDALMRNRTDGALVRLVSEVNSAEPLEAADRELSGFASTVAARLTDYVPD